MKIRKDLRIPLWLKIGIGMAIASSLTGYLWSKNFFLSSSPFSSSLVTFLPPPLSERELLTDKELKQLAESITVRIFSQEESGSRGGSGVLIFRQGDNYIVVTNNHVVSEAKVKYQIETATGKLYPVEIISNRNSNLITDDLALLKFNSEEEHPIIPAIINPQIKIGQKILAVGFPFTEELNQSRKLEFTKGEVAMILNRPLIGGYQFGYTNTVLNGMSGGPILNRKGQLVGLNGLGKYPIIGDPYVFKDGTNVSEQEWEEMSNLSWAIPPKYIVELLQKFVCDSHC